LVFLPGYDGIPVRGFNNGNIIDDEVVKRLRPVCEMHFRFFDLRDDKDKTLFEALCTVAASKPKHVRVITKKFPNDVSSTGKWEVAVEWVEMYLDIPVTGVFAKTVSPLEGV
jgi:hypothetical protein